MRHARPTPGRWDSAAPAYTGQRHNAGRSPGYGPGLPWQNHQPGRRYPNQTSRTPSVSAALQSANAISHRGPERLPDITMGEITATHGYGPGAASACRSLGVEPRGPGPVGLGRVHPAWAIMVSSCGGRAHWRIWAVLAPAQHENDEHDNDDEDYGPNTDIHRLSFPGSARSQRVDEVPAPSSRVASPQLPSHEPANRCRGTGFTRRRLAGGHRRWRVFCPRRRLKRQI